jgi:hypothetical protein
MPGIRKEKLAAPDWEAKIGLGKTAATPLTIDPASPATGSISK